MKIVNEIVSRSQGNRILRERPERAKELLKQWENHSADELAEELALGMAWLALKIDKEGHPTP